MDTSDLAPCGEVVLQLLKGDKLALDTCIRLADDHINSVDFHLVEQHWLGLYMHASLLRSEIDVGTSAALEGIKRVDMAIIVTGAVGREDWAQSVIKRLQQTVPRRPCKPWPVISEKKVLRTYPPIREIAAPSFEEYVVNESKAPFIVRGYANWPAMRRWQSTDYLLDMTGEGRFVPVETGGSYVDDDWGQTIMPWRQFVEDGRGYLAQHNLFKQFPELEKDIIVPDYAWMGEPMINVWIGGDTLSPAHTDPHNNCYVQVLGRKRVWVAPPECASHLEVYGQEDGFNSCMGNTTKVNVFEYDPRLKGTESVLEPGDLLVMPKGWWHAMQGLSSGWSVSIWF